MGWFQRQFGWLINLFGQSVPDDVAAVAGPDERVVAWGRTPDGAPVVATVAGLWLDERHFAWHLVHKATWQSGRLSVTPAVEVEPGVVVDAPPVGVRLAEPNDLPAEVRARVTRSVAHSTHHGLPGGGGVRVIARRIPGRDGLEWVMRFDVGTDLADPDVRAAASRLLDQSRVLLEAPV